MRRILFCITIVLLVFGAYAHFRPKNLIWNNEDFITKEDSIPFILDSPSGHDTNRIFIGHQAGKSTTTGSNNVFIGWEALNAP